MLDELGSWIANSIERTPGFETRIKQAAWPILNRRNLQNMMVAIINPVSGSSYTSEKSALDFVRRGRAVLENGMLRFVDREQRREYSRSGEAYWWNGSTGDKMHRPGEVRS